MFANNVASLLICLLNDICSTFTCGTNCFFNSLMCTIANKNKLAEFIITSFPCDRRFKVIAKLCFVQILYISRFSNSSLNQQYMVYGFLFILKETMQLIKYYKTKFTYSTLQDKIISISLEIRIAFFTIKFLFFKHNNIQIVSLLKILNILRVSVLF